MVGLVVIFALVVVAPPAWLLAFLSRRLWRQQQREVRTAKTWVLIAVTVVALAFQCAVAGTTLLEGFREHAGFGSSHAAALLVAWACLMLRIALKQMRGRRGRRQY
jgi:membrane-associated phospholipid phosphatase